MVSQQEELHVHDLVGSVQARALRIAQIPQVDIRLPASGNAIPTRTLTSRRKRTAMLLFVLRLFPLVQHFAGNWWRFGRKLENDPTVFCLELGKAPRPTMYQIGSGLHT
jgi:hypothetical protein